MLTAIQICVFTAFSLVPRKRLMRKCCLIHLKNNSTCQRLLYRAAMINGGKFRDEKYGKTLAEKKRNILQMAVDAVTLARQFTDDVEFYAEDAGRAEPDYLFEMIGAAIAAGATVVNIPDTTGYTVPEQYGSLIRRIRENVPGIERAVISVHCHDDLGMAVANTLAGVLNGARQVEG